MPVVDLRHRGAFAQGHLEGVTSIEYGAQCATYVGWLLPWGRPLVLVGDDERTVENAVVDLARIGIDTVAGVSTEPAPEHAPETGTDCGYRRLRWEALAEERRAGRRPLVIDVRSETEFAEGHVEGAVNAPVHELPSLVEHPARRRGMGALQERISSGDRREHPACGRETRRARGRRLEPRHRRRNPDQRSLES